MNTLSLVLSIVAMNLSLFTPIFSVISISSKSYVKYRRKLEEFEQRKHKIEEDLENERNKFN